MPRLKSTRKKPIKTKYISKRLAAKRKKSLQSPIGFEDIAVYFSEEEWRHLKGDQIDLYRQVMMDNYQTILSLGYQNEKPTLISKIEKDEDLYITELENHSRVQNFAEPIHKGHINAPRFNTAELHTSLLPSKTLAVEDLHSREGVKNYTKHSLKKPERLPLTRQYNFRNRVVVEYAKSYDDKVKDQECKPLKSLQKSSHGKIVNAPRFSRGELDTTSSMLKELKKKEIEFTCEPENGTNTMSNGNSSLPSKHPYCFRNRIAMEYSKCYNDKDVREFKPPKSLQRRSSYRKPAETPRFNMEGQHKAKELTVQEICSTDYNRVVENSKSYDDKVKDRECKPLKSLQKSSFGKIVNAPRFSRRELHTSSTTPKELKKTEIEFTCEPENSTKILSNINSSLSPKTPPTPKELKKKEKEFTCEPENSTKTLSNRNSPQMSPKNYNFRDRVSVEYTKFYDDKDEVGEPKRQEGTRYTCSECNKIYSSKPGLMKHQKIHTGTSIYVCSKCDKCFTQRSNLKRHESSHAVEKPWVCSYCGKGFTESSSLHKHQRIHTGLKPFVCTECGKTFSISTYLIVHQRTHTGEKPYECEDCGKCFTQSSSLITHQRIHTGIKPYKCVECRKSFTTSSHLITHQRTHTGERPYSCGECGMAFKHSTHLVLHKRKHTGERPYNCTKCPRKFAQRPQLLRHLQKIHELE